MRIDLKARLRQFGRTRLPLSTRRALVRLTRWPPVGLVRFGHLRRLTPISPDYGAERGLPIDRYYIQTFLARHAEDIQGRVLEIGDDTYTRHYGGNRVTQRDVLHVAKQGPTVTMIGDLAQADHIPSEIFDCIILTQTLQYIYDVPAAVRSVFRILKPRGVALVTVPGISKISRYDMEHWGSYWSFTSCSAHRLLGEAFSPNDLQVNAYGNVLAATAFLHGLASDELRPGELDYVDPDYEVIITVRARKPEALP